MLESRSLEFLQPEFKIRLEKLILECKKSKNLDVTVACTIRSPLEQARMWCRSRSEWEVDRMIAVLSRSAPRIANLLSKNFCSLGPRMTEHLPGQSWHQWGEAADIFVEVGGLSVWTGSVVRPIVEIAKNIGLEHSSAHKEWSPFSRNWHVQTSAYETPLMVPEFLESWSDVEERMLALWPWDFQNLSPV